MLAAVAGRLAGRPAGVLVGGKGLQSGPSQRPGRPQARRSPLVPHHPFSCAPPQVMLCKHRMGMICAAMRDSGAAAKLLEETRAHYEGQQAGHDLAREAQLGLALVALRAAEPLPPAQRREKQQQLLAQIQEQVGGCALPQTAGLAGMQGPRRCAAARAQGLRWGRGC